MDEQGAPELALEQDEPIALSVAYHVDATRTHAHCFDVKMRVDRAEAGALDLFLPAWIPGTYAIRDFARDVTRLQAGELDVVKTDKSSWRIANAPASFSLTYRVYARDLTPHGLYLDDERGFISPARVCLAVEDGLQAPLTLTLEVPAGFEVATTLRRAGERYRARDYYELIDHPLQIGALTRVPFAVEGAKGGLSRHEWIMSGAWRCDEARIAADLQLICEETCRLFESDPPADPYLFLASLVGEGYGGLEHRDSTHLIASRYNLPVAGDERVTEGYRTLLGLCSHEYIHAWWVKRVQPAALARPDLKREVPTRLLWLFEGFTAYYDDLVLVRAGVIDEQSYLELLAKQITRVVQAPGRQVRSLEEASFDAWMLLFRAPEHAPNATVSYYAKGATVALALDLLIRQESDNARSLDHVVRAFWSARATPVEEDGFLRVASEAAGFDLSEWYASYVEGRADPPVHDQLAAFGITWSLRKRRATVDRGGQWAREKDLAPVELGLVMHQRAPTKVQTVLEHTPAWRAGLASGDILLALDGARVHGSRLFRLLKRYQPGDEAELHVFRDDRLKSVRVRFDEPGPDVVYLRSDDKSEPEVLVRREHWLLGTKP